jgi:eukaryotic-like serine/threonine-protein kinase
MRCTSLCAGPEELQALLAGALTPEEEARWGDHLAECPVCQGRLERLAAADEASPESCRRLADRADEPEAALREAIEGLKGEGRTAAWEPPDLGAGPDPVFERLGPYEVVEVLGRGGNGVVLKAFDPALHRFVAIKVLHAHLATSPAARKRFAREGRAVAAVSHEHVVAVHGVDEQDGVPYLVMEYVSGISLQERLDRDAPLELTQVLRIGVQAARGLAAAHAQGLIHRDVKPANILLEKGVERVKLTDFGLARAADDASLTQSGVLAGTPQYMAPEQARGEPLDHRADLFSLGSVLYACCAGRPPFRAGTTLAVLRRITEEAPRPVRDVNPDVPEWLAAFIARLHAPDPDDRFQSANEVARRLERYLAHVRQPAHVPEPPHPGPRTRRPRFARLVGLAATAALMVVAAGAGGFVWWRSAAGANPPPSQAPEALGRWRHTEWDPQGPVLAVVPAPGGKFLASAHDNGTVCLWDLTQLNQRSVTALPHRDLKGHEQRVWSVAFSPDGKLLASGAGDWHHPTDTGELRLWDVATRRELPVPKPEPGPTALVFSVAFSPAGRTLATASWDGNVRLWRVSDGNGETTLELAALLRAHQGPARSVAFSPDGTLLASGGFDGVAVLWDLAGKQRLRTLVGAVTERTPVGARRLNAVAFAPDGRTLAVAENAGQPRPAPDPDQARRGRVLFWDVGTGEPRGVLEGHRGIILGVAFAPDGKTLASAGGDWDQFGEVKLWDVAGRRELQSLDDYEKWVEGVAFTPDGRTLATAGGVAGAEGDVRFWELPSPAPAPAPGGVRGGAPVRAGAMNPPPTRSVP